MEIQPRARFFQILGIFILMVGISLRVYVALNFQSRAWVDEIWVVFDLAYKLFSGAPAVIHAGIDDGIRSWVPPLLVAGYLRILSFLGIQSGATVLPIVRLTITMASAVSFVVYAFLLQKKFQLRFFPVLPVFVLFLIPEFIHYGTTGDLSVLALPPLLFSFWLVLSEEERHAPTLKSRLGFFLLNLSVLIRFQFGVFALCMLFLFFWKKQWQKALELTAIGVAVLIFEFALNSWIYGRPILPILNYFTANAVEGLAAGYGVTPFYVAFELLWRFVTEPVFLLIFATAFFALKRQPFLVGVSLLFFAIHTFIGHKEYRFFYAPAVLLAGVASASLQKWLEENRRIQSTFIVGIAFAVFFLGFAAFRATKKVRWQDFEIPSKIETLAGTYDDLRGLITYGWGGIHFGSNYTVYRKEPYAFAQDRQELIGRRRNGEIHPSRYNYVVTSASEPHPCAQEIAREGGGVLYRCSTSEIEKLTSF